MSEVLISVRNMVKNFPIKGGIFSREIATVQAVSNVSFDIKKGETLGLVGESGCGKSTLGRCILRLIEPSSGRVMFGAQDVTALRKGALRRLRRHMQIVFQDPFSSLDPRMTVEAAIGQPFDVFGVPGGQPRHERVRELLEAVGLDASSLHRFPLQFSGGQRQRNASPTALE